MSLFKTPLFRPLALFKHSIDSINVCFGGYVYSHQPGVSTFIRATKAAQRFEQLRESGVVHGIGEEDAIGRVSTRSGDSGHDVPPLDFVCADHILFTETVSEDRNIAQAVQATAERFGPECFGFVMIIPKLNHYLFQGSICAGLLCHADPIISLFSRGHL